MSLLWILLGVVLFIVVGGLIGAAQGGNFGEMGCAYLSLGLIVLMGFCGHRKHQERKALQQIEELKGAVVRFYEDCGRYPGSDEGLAALIVKPANCEGWKKYLETNSIPEDPWGNKYFYSSGEATFQITSRGRKQEPSDDITVNGGSAEQSNPSAR